MDPLELVDYEIFGNTLLGWTTGAGVVVLSAFLMLAIRRILRSRLRKLAARNEITALTVAEHTVDKTRGWFIVLISLYLGSRFWELAEPIEVFATKIAWIVFLLQAGLWVTAAAMRFIEVRRADELEDNRAAVAAIDVMSFVVRLAIWSIVLLVMLDNLGVDVTTLVAGLGVGGVAVALAAQNILGDLFASLSIVLDKPFVVGDFLNVDEHLGTVEKVGIKTVRLRSLSGEQLIFSNNDLLNSRIRNYGRMFERRVVFSVGVTYQTTAEQLRMMPDLLRSAVEAQEQVRFDRAHFQKYGDFALVFEIVYYVLSPDYNSYMDIQQAVNLEIFETFQEHGIEFAYPTQTLFLQRAAAEPA